jgi:regulator of protease activity HflC (stomatin/prohibitin superfamily)
MRESGKSEIVPVRLERYPVRLALSKDHFSEERILGGYRERLSMFGGYNIFVLIVVLLAVLTLFLGVKTVPQGYNWTVERFGRYTRMLRPGLNLVVPFVDRIGRKMNVMEQVIDIPEQEVITKDNATVTVDGIAFFQVFDAAKASYEIASLEPAIVKLTMTNIRSVMGSLDLDQILSHRDEINERLLRVVDAAVSPWGIKVNRIEIKDIVPPANLIEAMGRQMKAEREKRAEVLAAEGQRQSAILRAEGAKQAQILEAEGRREAAFRDAEARERSATAEAMATEVVSRAIAQGQVASINYFIADKYLKALTEIARSPNQKILMLPIEVMGVLGSLGGIAEIARATFGGGPYASPPAPPPAVSAGGAANGVPRSSVPAVTANPDGADTKPAA